MRIILFMDSMKKIIILGIIIIIMKKMMNLIIIGLNTFDDIFNINNFFLFYFSLKISDII